MRSVNIADLKNNLNTYLDQVRQGEEILIKDRREPIAKIVPFSTAEHIDEEEKALVATGELRPRKQLLPESFWSTPAPRVSLKRAVAAVVADRDED